MLGVDRGESLFVDVVVTEIYYGWFVLTLSFVIFANTYRKGGNFFDFQELRGTFIYLLVLAGTCWWGVESV
jgi:hypothetical protein